MRFKVRRIPVILLMAVSLPALAAIEEYAFDTEQQEARFKKLTHEMRCPKCLNSPISGSDAPIAADIRNEIYDQIRSGRSNDEIVEFMSSRYGDFILYRPPLKPGTYVLWFGPAILLLAGFVVIRRMLKNSQQASLSETALSPQEQEKLRKILASRPDS